MWSDMIYLIPVASVLSMAELKEDTELKGDLQEELIRLIGEYLPSGSIAMIKNEEIISAVDMTYPKRTNLWTILDTIMANFGLSLSFKSLTDRKIQFVLVPNSDDE